MAASDPNMRSLIGRAGAHASWANTDDRTARTAAARAAWLARFEKQVDPDGVLDPRERTIRAEHARRAHLLSLSIKAAMKRKKAREKG